MLRARSAGRRPSGNVHLAKNVALLARFCEPALDPEANWPNAATGAPAHHCTLPNLRVEIRRESKKDTSQDWERRAHRRITRGRGVAETSEMHHRKQSAGVHALGSTLNGWRISKRQRKTTSTPDSQHVPERRGLDVGGWTEARLRRPAAVPTTLRYSWLLAGVGQAEAEDNGTRTHLLARAVLVSGKEGWGLTVRRTRTQQEELARALYGGVAWESVALETTQKAGRRGSPVLAPSAPTTDGKRGTVLLPAPHRPLAVRSPLCSLCPLLPDVTPPYAVRGTHTTIAGTETNGPTGSAAAEGRVSPSED
ncbi:hypothetical protein SCHPADRAFT_946048 [Schizopora paradoxa]|uniref:Uncharacterized protein n=1 Tax=Schizopora paradoxa TaxID=27342 RepID=A0A0H2RAI5_9AGAM|nr:hypothetical protein SCHPADRAFT_946048 [Schizopora paradoxa]